MPTRSCVGCRQRRHTNALLHLQRIEGEVRLATTSTQARGRGAWVCANVRCMRLLSESPAVLNRAFRAKVRLADDLLSQARSLEWSKVEHWLGQCHRQGLIYRDPLEQSGEVSRPSPSMWIWAADVDRVVVEGVHALGKGTAVSYTSILNEVDLGARTGRGPRPFLAFREGRSTQRIHHHLQRWADMG